MRRPGPLLTLSAGVALAGVLGVVNAMANTSAEVATTAAPPAATAAPSPPPAAPPTATAQPTAAPQVAKAPQRVNYAGRTEIRRVAVAIAIRDGGAVAYVCDGQRVESWLLGSANNGRLTLSGEGQSRLTGTYGGGKATGTVWVGSKAWRFSIPAVQAPQGLYRGDGTVGGVRVRGGWIVLPDGQTGVATTGDTVAPAPELDPAEKSVTVGGTEVPVVAVSGLTGGGF
jgi:hypothetical protein